MSLKRAYYWRQLYVYILIAQTQQPITALTLFNYKCIDASDEAVTVRDSNQAWITKLGS